MRLILNVSSFIVVLCVALSVPFVIQAEQELLVTQVEVEKQPDSLDQVILEEQQELAAHPTLAEQSDQEKQIQLVFQNPELRDDIAEVRRTMNGQLAEYRTAAQAFTIAQGQFKQLNTLSSLESAIQATRLVYEKRAAVLRTYLELLRLELLNTNGVDPQFEEYALVGIEKLDAGLQRHIDQTRLSLDRQSIGLVADQFDELAKELQTHIHITRQVLQLARYQAVSDAFQALLAQIAIESEELENEKRVIQTPQDIRAFEQILIRATDTQSLLDEARSEIEKSTVSSARQADLNIEQFINKSYANFRQTILFIRELL